ncbi:MAG: response regulator [Bacteroidia bacterium]
MAEQRLLVIIDDEEDILDLLEYNFLRVGFCVEAFNRAKPALEFLSQKKPAAILCDWMMPEMTGLELCRAIKENISLADIPFLMVTCRTETSAVKMALAEGVTDYIRKPVRISDLIGKVQTIIGV